MLSEDKSYTTYPFTLDYHNAGAHRSDGEFSGASPDQFSALAHQARATHVAVPARNPAV